ncbi:MAG: phenylalanine--tRNA ligase subunit beta [Candidatus Taylorbacteria bacterium]|nr:phenylalanine--tRNA ligase subunit beta [Candidatus Taylorbacteria bacterium]
MFISYKWLQGYFEEKLPEPERLAELLTFSFAEVESIQYADGRGYDRTQINADEDVIFDIKVLPDRACYALSHRGVAYEVAALTGFPKKQMEWPQPEIAKDLPELDVRVEEPEPCPRYMARRIRNISPKANPWTKEHLDAIGQRSINPIVDGANIVMFDMGQPLHAFDADKVEGGIVVRMARKGEKITTLDNKEVNLSDSILVIADHKGPLAIAGIKGGKKAEVTSQTKNLILESASFNASYIRKASERLGIKTDASKRYENRISPEQAAIGMNDFTAYLFETDKNLSAGKITDVRYSNILENVGISVTPGFLAEKIGLKLSEEEIEEVLKRLQIGVEKKEGEWMLTPPFFRLDLTIPEDIAEEVGRIVGYEKIPAVLPPKSAGAVLIPKSFYYEWKIREILVRAGFSEVMTSSFSAHGDVAIEKPLAEDKQYARPNLRDGEAAALKTNALNAPLFGGEAVKIFEIGRVFPESGEVTALAIGVAGAKDKTTQGLSSAVALLSKSLGVPLKGESKEGIFECDLDAVFAKLPEPKSWDISVAALENEKFKPFPPYPFIVRDIAFFVPAGAEPEKVHKLILKEAGKFVVRSWRFDRFEKDGEISYAFRLVFQSPERTLTDEEVNKVMDHVSSSLETIGCIIR